MVADDARSEVVADDARSEAAAEVRLDPVGAVDDRLGQGVVGDHQAGAAEVRPDLVDEADVVGDRPGVVGHLPGAAAAGNRPEVVEVAAAAAAPDPPRREPPEPPC